MTGKERSHGTGEHHGADEIDDEGGARPAS